MEYLLESGEWLPDPQLYDGAPVRLFETMAEADAAIVTLALAGRAGSVGFMVDWQGRVLTGGISRANRKPRSAGSG